MSRDSGGPRNRLASARSPYLLLHRHNPVDWYEWGEEAISRARREDKPIFLSVGYSTCYWCHVMERESFSDEAIAAQMNADFVNIKLDREERPDLDEIYMTATQILTGHGGWPNSLFLTPALEPFFAGTYFPPVDRPGLPGFPTVLRSMSHAWKERREDVESQAESVAGALRQHLDLQLESSEERPAAAAADRALADLERSYDREHSGFGGAPKFPTPSNLLLLLELEGERETAREMLAGTLDRMARGGIYDQLGGGFHRYATDREWKVPHFEKMLYDNGLLLEVYGRAHAAAPGLQSERVMRQTATFLGRELTSPEGAFWSALDAETDGREGAFYVWTRDELLQALGEEDFAFLAPLYGFQGPPFFEGSHYVLHLPEPLERQAARRRVSHEELIAEIEGPRRRLFETRRRRPSLAVDDKILADWNGLAIAGLAIAGRVLGEPKMISQARSAAEFVLGSMRTPAGALLHAWRAGGGVVEAFLADYAYLTHGLLELEEASGEESWGEAAHRLTAEQIDRLEDPRGGFFSTVERRDLLVRSKDYLDGALPAANAVAILNLLRLVPREASYGELAEKALRAAAGPLEKAPSAARFLALAARRGGLPSGGEVPGGAAPEEPAMEASTGEPDDDGWRELRLTLDLAPGWHVYDAYEAGDAPEWVRPTTLTGEGCELAAVRFPEPRSLSAGSDGGEARVHGGRLEIGARVRFDSPRPVLVVSYQLCDESRCLAAAERRVPLA